MSDKPAETVDAVVIGAGFGGLGTALRLAEGGAKVVLCETLKYPGGCASTFSHKGYRFDAGATLLAGLAEGQLFARWLARHGQSVDVEILDPILTLRTPDFELPVPKDRDRFRDALAAVPGIPDDARLDRFLTIQRDTADALWPVLDDPDLLPPLGVAQVLAHAKRLPSYLPALRFLGRPLSAVLAACGLERCEPLRQVLDAICQITLQCPADEAEAPVALATLDYFFRGAAHVRGGVGELAEAMVRAFEQAGGEIRYATRVKSIEAVGRRWRVTTRRGVLDSGVVAANLLPQNLAAMLPEKLGRRFAGLARDVDGSWGAAMLYRVLEAPGDACPDAHHLEMVQDPSQPFLAGNHLFASLSSAAESERAGPGRRTLTVSTHVPMDELRRLDAEAQGAYIHDIQERLRRGLRDFAPDWWNQPVFETTASPRTFERFTGRRDGLVGGVPRRAGLGGYLGAFYRPSLPGLALVGDSAFPGQSALATAAGGAAVARRLLGRLDLGTRQTRTSGAPTPFVRPEAGAP
ncbi:MAG: NAD(P)/FAD-dependent oxidoreductase [Acidobacteriota bacterium]